MTIAELWSLIDKSNGDTRMVIQQDLDEVRTRLDSFLTKDQFAAEKALMELRLERAERELRDLDAKHTALAEKLHAERVADHLRRAQELEEERLHRVQRQADLRSNVLYKVVIPTLLVLLPLLMALWSPLK